MPTSESTEKGSPVPTEELVRYFVERLSGRVGRTMLLKLIYLADIEARRYLGRPISGLSYYLHHHGPFDPEIYRAIDALTARGEISEEQIVFPAGVGYRYSTSDVGRPHSFARTEEAILAYVLSTYASCDLSTILDVVYESKPMKQVESRPLNTPIPMECVDSEMRILLGGVDLESALLAEEQARDGKTIPWHIVRRELLDRDLEASGGEAS